MMNWAAIGNATEAVSALAVIITLVFLTLQLRQNTKAIELSTQRGVIDDAYQWMYKVIENPQVAELYLAGMRGDELSSSDRLRFGLLMNTLFTHWSHAFSTGAFEVVNGSQIAGVLAHPGGLRYWKRTIANKTLSMSPQFIAMVNTLLHDLEKLQPDASQSA